MKTQNNISGRAIARRWQTMAVALCGLMAALISQVAVAGGFTVGNFDSAEDLGWDVGSTPQNTYVQALEIGNSASPTFTVGALTFTNVGNAGSGSGHNFFNASFSGAYAAQMNALIDPLGLSLKPSSPPFSGLLSGLVVGQDYRLTLISYDGDGSINDPTDRGNWTFTVGADSATVNAWSALGLPIGTHVNTMGSYFQYQFVAGAPSTAWLLDPNDIGKYALLTALTLEALPEPNTVMLVGIGGLLVLRRTRRLA